MSLLVSLAILLTLLIVGAEGDPPDPPPPEVLGVGWVVVLKRASISIFPYWHGIRSISISTDTKAFADIPLSDIQGYPAEKELAFEFSYFVASICFASIAFIFDPDPLAVNSHKPPPELVGNPLKCSDSISYTMPLTRLLVSLYPAVGLRTPFSTIWYAGI